MPEAVLVQVRYREADKCRLLGVSAESEGVFLPPVVWRDWMGATGEVRQEASYVNSRTEKRRDRE